MKTNLIDNLEVFYVLGNEYLLRVKENFYECLVSDKLRKKNSSYFSLEEINDFIMDTVCWYVIKYPDSQLSIDDNYLRLENHDYDDNSDMMTINNFTQRLSSTWNNLLNARYVNNFGRNYYDYWKSVKNKELRNENSHIFVRLRDRRERKNYIIVADERGNLIGKAPDIFRGEIRNNYNNMDLRSLLNILRSEKRNDIDYEELEEVVKRNDRDLVVRDYIVNFVSLELVYYGNTKPEYGYFRAKKFIEDFNKKFNMNLSSNYLDLIMSGNYSYDNYDYVRIMNDNKKKNNKYKKGKKGKILKRIKQR